LRIERVNSEGALEAIERFEKAGVRGQGSGGAPCAPEVGVAVSCNSARETVALDKLLQSIPGPFIPEQHYCLNAHIGG